MREKIKLLSRRNRPLLRDDQRTSACTGQAGMRKFDPLARKHVAYKESKIK